MPLFLHSDIRELGENGIDDIGNAFRNLPGLTFCEYCLSPSPNTRVMPLSHLISILRGNRISRVPSMCFIQNRNITELDLGSNQIPELDPDSFSGLQNLSKLCVIRIFIMIRDKEIDTKLIRSEG